MNLGIGVITYNRLDYLKKCIKKINELTKIPYYLVIADDGSSDGTIEWCKKNNLTVISGANRGIAWNKNRALYALINYSDSENILLLEEDCIPNSTQWAEEWNEAISIFGHVNYARSDILSNPNNIKKGSGTKQDPYLLTLLTGQCIGSSRSAIERVGYFDSRFKGFGHEHVEWTKRFQRAGYGIPKDANIETFQDFLCITGFLKDNSAPTYANKTEIEINEKIMQDISNDPVYRLPWTDESEKNIFLEENSKINLKLIEEKQSIDYEENSFDWKFYINRYPDLKNAGIDTEEKALEHYLSYGKKEGRQINSINQHLD